MKRKHWTQTRKGKAILRKRIKERHNREKSNGAPTERRNDEDAAYIFGTAYIFGKVQTLIEYYAASNHLSVATLTARVAALLRHTEDGEVLGAHDHLSHP